MITVCNSIRLHGVAQGRQDGALTLGRPGTQPRHPGKPEGRRAGALLAVLPLLMTLVFGAVPGDAWARYASIVIDARTGEPLHEVEPDAPRYPASMTKMMTLYLLFQEIRSGRIGLNDPMLVSGRAAGQPASKLGLSSGLTIRVEDAILALVIQSANDVATVVAEHIGGSETEFARLMTAQANRLGMSNTTFRNASGLPDPGQVSTARDMARLLQALRQDFPEYYPYLSRRQFTWNGRTYKTHNRLLNNYAGADGGKTGYIRASGFNVATSAERDGRRLIGVVFGGQSPSARDQHMAVLLNGAFKQDPFQRLAATPPTAASTVAADTAEARLPVAPVVVAEVSETRPPVAERLNPATTPTRSVAKAIKKSTPSDGVWAIQVGAFSSLDAARGAANQALKNIRASGRAQVKVTAVPRANQSPLYRARIIGLTEKTARAACGNLPKGCYPVAHPPGSV